MITSNINEILLKNEVKYENNSSIKNNSFLNSVIDSRKDEPSKKTTDFTYENIKGMSLEDIDSLFTNEEDKQMAKNLRITTMFTEDKHLSQALFNTVLGQPFQVGYEYLLDRFNDKHSYLKSLTSSDSLSDILDDYISNKIDFNTQKKENEVVPQKYLDEILSKVNSFDFLSVLSNTSKDQYGRYKDKDDNYAFLYNDYYLKYQELLYKYEDLKSYDENIINQY